MVKKLISGFMKKKDKGESNKEAPQEEEDVPDELPPLAEDVEDKGEGKGEDKEESKEEKEEKQAPEKGKSDSQEQSTEESQEEPPEELPSLDFDEESSSGSEESSEGEELPDEIKRAKQAKTKKPSEEEKEEGDKEEDKEEKKEPAEQKEESGEGEKESETKARESASREKPQIEKEVGFFSSILDHLKKNDGSKEKLLSGDLYSRMANYWELKKDEIKGEESLLPTERKLEKELVKTLEGLKTLEKKWQVQKLALEEDIKFLHEREREIQTKLEELKRISNELNLFKNVKPEEYFRMQNGVVLKNLHDLIDALEIIDDETFHHHVTSHKNDFANWIKNTIKDNNLAEKLRKAKTKHEMIEVLESEPPVLEHLKKRSKKQLPSRKYLKLANGVVIKSLYELLDALKAMDEDLFDKHVTEDKNDFADWAKKTLKDEELADKLEKSRGRKDMVHILEIYL